MRYNRRVKLILARLSLAKPNRFPASFMTGKATRACCVATKCAGSARAGGPLTTVRAAKRKMIATPPPVTQVRTREFREQLLKRVWIADGAMGTVLYGKGIFINRCFDELNLSSPAMVKETDRK